MIVSGRSWRFAILSSIVLWTLVALVVWGVYAVAR